MEENSINVGDQIILFVKKIEKLTLYVIVLDEKENRSKKKRKMKYNLLIMIFNGAVFQGVAQTNTFPSNGSVGIGTVNPVTTYYYDSAPALQISDRTTLFQLTGNLCTYLNNNLYYNSGWKYQQNGRGAQLQIGGGFLAFVRAPQNIGGADAAATPEYSMMINEGGNVGIGTANPVASLDIQTAVTSEMAGKTIKLGSTGYLSNLTVNNATYLNDNLYYDGVNWRTRQALGGTYAVFSKGIFEIGNAVSGGLDGVTVPVSRLYISPDGNIGIGTSSPAEKLSVNGSVTARRLIATQLSWSDYVFNEDYKLRPLAEVAQFIKENKHLPEMPSAKEVKEKGVDLGTTQALLLKKIEELTLHLIALDQKNAKLEAQNKGLEERLQKLENR